MKDPEKRSLLKDGSSGPSSMETSADHGMLNSTDYNGMDGMDHPLYPLQEYPPKNNYMTIPMNKRHESVYEGGVTLSWKNVKVKAAIEAKRSCFSCLKKREPPAVKNILRNVCGVAKAGSFLVIMGASGSGKTTLMNYLTRRHIGGLDADGQVLINGRPIGEEINSVSGYIQQDDLFVGTLTVKEHLWFNAVLRMGKHLTDDERWSRIEEVMQEMGLKKCQDTVIGVPGMVKGLSGGEKKRLAFASELLTRPSIMFCDEPTSGLDSFMAQSVVESLKKLTERGRTVLCTIHQPSSEVFAMFDEILLMAEGRVAFMGPITELTRFFNDLGYTCPNNYNPADYFIMTLAIVPGREQDCRDRVERICDTYEESSFSRSIQYQIEEQEIVGSDKFVVEMNKVGNGYDKKKNDEPHDLLAQKKEYQATWFKQFQLCLWRSVLDVRRNKKVLPARVMQILVAGLFLGVLYWQQTYDKVGVANINGAMFMLMIQVSFNTAFTIATAFAREFPVFLKENQDRQYSVSAYYLGKICVDLPVIAFSATIYTCCSYWMIGLYPSAERFFICLAGLVLLSQIAVSYGHLASAIFPNPQLALTLLPFMLGLTLLFTGFLVDYRTVLWIFKPIAWISAFRYTYEILIINQWTDVTSLACSKAQEAAIMASNMTTPMPGTQDVGNWCYPNGLAIIYNYGYDPDVMPYNFMLDVVIFFCVEFIGYCFLRYKAYKKT